MNTPAPSNDGILAAKTGETAKGKIFKFPLKLFRGTIGNVARAMKDLEPGEVVRVLTNDP